jgi:polygalacturonase
MKKIKIFFTATLICFAFHIHAKDYYVSDFGAKADGKTVNTRTIQRAIDFVNEKGGGRLVFQVGNYVTGSIYLKSNVTLHLEPGAALLGSTNPLDYVIDPMVKWSSMIFAINQENIGITGKGTINGRGFTTANNLVSLIHRGIFEDDLVLDRPREWRRPQNIYFRECINVTIKDIFLRDPASWNQTYDQCQNVYVEGIYVDSKAYWNNDGIDIVDCDGVIIKNCYFDAADDVICFKSHDANSICQNVTVENCVGRSSANGIKFGTVSRGGFKNFKIKNVTIFNTFRSAITFATVDGGIIENIEVDSIRSINTGNVIFLRIGERWSQGKQPNMKNIRISNVYAEVPMSKPDAGYNYEGPVEDNPRNISPAIIFGLPDHKIQDVILKNIEIVYPGGGNPFYAFRGTSKGELDSIPDMRDKYPEFSQWKELPAWGFYIRHADGIILDNVKLTAEKKDYRPSIVIDNVNGATFKKVEFIEPESIGKQQIIQNRSSNVIIK